MNINVPTSKLTVIRSLYHVTPINQLAQSLRISPQVIEQAAEKMGLKNPKPRKEFLTTRHSEAVRESFFEPEQEQKKRTYSDRSGLTSDQKELIIKMYPTTSNAEIADAAGCRATQVASLAKRNNLKKSADFFSTYFSKVRREEFAKKVSSGGTSKRAVLIRALSNATNSIKARDHFGALQAIEEAINFLYSKKL